MFSLLLFLALLFLLLFFFTSLLWVAFGKLFRIDNLTFKKAFITCILVSLMGGLIQLIEPLLLFFGISNFLISIFISVTALVAIIWVLKNRLNTTVIKAVGLHISTIIFGVCFALLLRAYVVEPFKISSGGMNQTIIIGDQILVNKFIYKFLAPKQGDIIVFKYPKDPSKNYIKRVVAISGDIIEIKEKQVFINNKLLSEEYVIHIDEHILNKNFSSRDYFGPFVIPKNSYFVMGDNRDNSSDSRFWGVVEDDAVKGKMFILHWSWDKKVEQVRWNRIGRAL